PSSRMHGVNIP
ncbi:dihydroorotate dehydrogenase domain protein, partial [Vibrio parahaemolyticus EKP-021]